MYGRSGVVLVTPTRRSDERGYFDRTWDQAEFASHGLNPRIVQRNASGNRAAGTLRGLHYQLGPHAEAKLISCSQGAIYDVALDVRRDSPTFGRWVGIELWAKDGSMLYTGGLCARLRNPPTGLDGRIPGDGVLRTRCLGRRALDDPAFGVRWPLPRRLCLPRPQLA